MCSDCGLEAVCSYCSRECVGTCDDPDTCPTCWYFKHVDDEAHPELYHDGYLDDCLDDGCQCQCHAEEFKDGGLRLMAGVLVFEEDWPPYERRGVFPFLSVSSTSHSALERGFSIQLQRLSKSAVLCSRLC